jgi:lysophospholipase L1-like esterase
VVASVEGVVFYDENGNGVPDPAEEVRLPGVTISIDGRTAVAGTDGTFVVESVPGGTWPVQVVASSLPPYFEAPPASNVSVPPGNGTVLAVGLTLPIGSNQPNVYMAFGDSITVGDGSRDGHGYRSLLASDLHDYLGSGEVVNEGVEATDSWEGVDRILDSLAYRRPAYALIHYGTNDWNRAECRLLCGTTENIRQMVQVCRAQNSLPVVATIIPANPAYTDRMPAQRNAWIDGTNLQIRAMAKQEGVLLVDLNAAFVAADPDLVSLFSDHVHPNDRGYAIMAQEFFRGLVSPRGQ